MFIYFDRNGVLQEVINDKAARLGDLNANEIYVYVDEVELDDIWLTLKRPDGTLSVEKSFIANKVVREIPYDPKRDMKFFKDYKEYEFYKFTISDEITIAGVYQATIRMTYEDTLSALGVLVFKAETGVIKSDQNITQAQYDYLIWYVGSWQGQIGDLEEAMGIAQADILDLQNRMNVAEQDINKIEDGTTVVNKALKDDLGNTIKSTYANKLDLVYSSSNNRIAITLKSYDGNSIDADLIDLPKATTSADGLLSKEDKVKIDNIASDIASMGATKQSLSEKNQINGYAGLDANAKIPSSLLPDSVLGQLEYKGTFTPTAYPLSPEKGWFYISIGNGTIGGVDFQVGDWAVFNGSTWDKVDNTDAVMSVNGKIGVVVLNGTDIKVGNGDTWTIEQRIVNIYAELNNRYTKAQTYSQTEIEQRLTDLLGMANLQDILIGSYTDGQTVSASDLSPYNFVIVLGKDVDNTYTGTFKPSEIVSGNIVSLSPTVYLTRGATDFTITTPTSVKLWGIKLDGITADEIGYDGTISGLNADNVQDAIDAVVINEPLKNLFNINTILDGYRFDDNGNLIKDNVGFTTDFIDIGLSKIYSSYLDANNNRVGAAMRRIAGYDSNKNFVGMVSTTVITVFINIDENVKYIRVSYPNVTYKNELMIYRVSIRGLGNTTETYSPYQSNPKVRNELMDEHLLEDRKYPKYITTNAYVSDFTFIKDKLFMFSPSDVEAGYGYIHVIKPNTKILTANFFRSGIKHNFGHVNTVDYNKGNDCLIFGNGSGSYIVNNGKFYIMKNPYEKILTTPEENTIDLTTNTIEFDCSSLDLGVKLNACWGYDNNGRNDIAILITNDNGIFTFVQLGKGNNDLGLGNFIEGTDDDEFNGSFKVVNQFVLEGREQGPYDSNNVNQGSVYHNGYLYLAIGHAPNTYWKVSFGKNGIAKYEETYEPFFDSNGTILESTGYANEGITICKDCLVLGLQINNEQTKLLIKDLK